MLVFDFVAIGNKLYEIRKKRGLTQAQVAEEADISDRSYADIERGAVNMRIETMLRICKALNISPDEIFIDLPTSDKPNEAALLERLNTVSEKERETAFKLLEIYLNSLM